MSTILLLRHQSGSKVNQNEQFALDSLTELTLGRDPACSVVFDAQRDDVVGRRHATIRITQGDRPSFAIVDNNSANGTLVNGTRIAKESELLPGDTVQLGVSGPSFVFDLEPRPPHLMARTRAVPDARPATTRIVGAEAEAPAAARTPTAPTARPGVGRETVQRMLTEERQATGRKWMYALAGVLVLVAAGGGGLFYRMRVDRQQLETKAREADAATALALEQQKTELTQKTAQEQAKLKEQLGLTPSDIVQKYGNSTVYIQVKWRLVDRETGKPLFHKLAPPLKDGTQLPEYVRLTSGKIVRWLTTEDAGRSNQEVAGAGTASGFVISDQGYILTNKHVAAGWLINYNHFQDYEKNVGVLFQEQPDRRKPTFTAVDTNDSEFQQALDWVPEQGGMIFDLNYPVRIGATRKFEGRNEELEVQFPDNRLSIAARLVRASSDADVALIKIDSPEPLTPVQLATDDTVTIGGPITVLGYPGASLKTIAASSTIESGSLRRQQQFVPEPTVTPGIIARLSVGMKQDGAITVIGPAGDLYQLTAPAGAGNSGGPVFDSNGKVIGLFTYGTKRETMTMAVPIRYGRALLPVQFKN
jgi:S1-C subfamily serine protease